MQIIPVKWQKTIEKILEIPKGVVFLLGGVDTGKTTFALLLADEATKRGIKVGIVDADVGQSTFGPPTTISFVEVPPKCKETITKLEPKAFYFVGNNSPMGSLLPSVIGAKKMVERARFSGCELIIVDTTGLIIPPMGTALKYHKIQLLRPKHIVAFERGNELRVICKSLFGYKYFKLFRLDVPSQVKIISEEERRKIRNAGYRAYFKKTKTLKLDLEKISLFPSEVDLLKRDDLVNLLVGLTDAYGDTLGVAKIFGINQDRKTVELLSPLNDGNKIASLVFGRVKLNSAYEEFEKIPAWRIREKIEPNKQ